MKVSKMNFLGKALAVLAIWTARPDRSGEKTVKLVQVDQSAHWTDGDSYNVSTEILQASE